MSIQTTWDTNAKILIRVVFSGSYTWQEYDATTDQIVMMMKSVPHIVDVMILLDKDAPPPAGESSLSHFRRSMELMPSNLGVLITVGKANLLTHLLFSTLIAMRKIRRNTNVVNTEEEARHIISKSRETVS